MNTRRVDVSDYDLGEGSVPTAIYNDLAEFTYGWAYTESQTFPISFKERIAVGNLDFYAMDTYKPAHKCHFHRRRKSDLEHRSRNQQRLFARPAGSFLDLSHSINQPLDQAIQTGVQALFPSTPLLVWQPRVSLAYQVDAGTVVHFGFGVFNDIIPAQIADLAATNAPYAPTFVGGIGGQVGGFAIAPGVPNSAADAAVQRQPAVPVALQRRWPALRGHCRRRAHLPSGRQPQYLPDRHAQNAVLLPVQPRH